MKHGKKNLGNNTVMRRSGGSSIGFRGKWRRSGTRRGGSGSNRGARGMMTPSEGGRTARMTAMTAHGIRAENQAVKRGKNGES